MLVRHLDNIILKKVHYQVVKKIPKLTTFCQATYIKIIFKKVKQATNQYGCVLQPPHQQEVLKKFCIDIPVRATLWDTSGFYLSIAQMLGKWWVNTDSPAAFSDRSVSVWTIIFSCDKPAPAGREWVSSFQPEFSSNIEARL